MNDAIYTIGLDYGSLSCRGVLAALDGSVAAEAEYSSTNTATRPSWKACPPRLRNSRGAALRPSV